MSLAYLIDPENQFMTKSGTINVDGFLKVFDAVTDDPAVTYKDFSGTENTERITLDNNGRAVVIADSEKAYRLEVYDRYGTLLWTTTPLWCLSGGDGGAGLVDIVSSDYSVDVDKTVVGSSTTFDLSVARDSTEGLEWIRTSGYTAPSGAMVPTYSDGTMEVGARGIRLYADRYYHVTARLITSTQQMPTYDEFALMFKGVDSGDNTYTFSNDRLIVDCTTDLHQDFEVSFDVIPEADVELYAETSGLASGVSVGLTEVQVHRVYSGVPSLPGSIATKAWVAENYQEILSGGPGIELSGNYIAVDFDTVQGKIQEGDGIDIVGDTVSVDFSEVQAKLEAGANIDITGNVISATVPEYAEADWDATSGEPGYIRNKPENLVQDADYVHTDNNFSDSDKSKLAGIEAGAQVNVNSDWDATSGQPGFIENKPDLSIYATSASLAPVATSGDYDDLTNKPDLSDYVTDSELADYTPTASLAPVALSGDYDDLTNKPTIPAAQVNSDWNASSGVAQILNKPTLATVATSGDYDDLTNKPTIPAAQVNSDWNAVSGVAEILNKPSIPVIGTITI